MTYGWPSTLKPTWHTNPASRIANTVSRSYLPRFGSRLTWVRSVGVKSLMLSILVSWGRCARAKLASRGRPAFLRGEPRQQFRLGEGFLPHFVVHLAIFGVAQIRVGFVELLHHVAHQRDRRGFVGFTLKDPKRR